MLEPYFEDQLAEQNGTLQFPFWCNIHESQPTTSLLFEAHWHYYIEILYSLSGSSKIFLNGEYYDFSAGDMILINAREVHSGFTLEPLCTKYIVLKLDPEVLYTTSRAVFESKYILPFTLAKSSPQQLFKADEIKRTIIPVLLNTIYQEFIEKKYGFELAVHTYICQIFLWILRHLENKGIVFDAADSLKENDLQMLQKVFDYVDKNYNEEITVESVARRFNMSYSYFSRHFKALMGKTFTEYLNYIRITQAEKLLLTTDLNITQVAMQAGFSDNNYFIRQFKHLKNITPKQFKKKIVCKK